ncbi:hypothetical protein HOLleu_00389 [Holothuria leucospilota]|uniref:Uncharacterized protein n=1 Tax=Holothuria leucospilota TaxID=206669 RepID=A0A9Q1CMN8_HOLLE|nr:hypothetical protein HOLleu_00389 [Holothuria leucospilota]
MSSLRLASFILLVLTVSAMTAGVSAETGCSPGQSKFSDIENSQACTECHCSENGIYECQERKSPKCDFLFGYDKK